MLHTETQQLRALQVRSMLSTCDQPPEGELCISDTSSTDRSKVESYISTVFRRIHGANIQDFMPLLLSFSSGSKVRAALGIRPAASQTLFLESYLNKPLIDAITETGINVDSREGIYEVGNLVSTRPGFSQLLFICLTKLLDQKQGKVAIFTATREVARLLSKLGLELKPVCEAKAERVEGEGSGWGSYYENCPWVFIVDVKQAQESIEDLPSTQQWLSDRADNLEQLTCYL